MSDKMPDRAPNGAPDQTPSFFERLRENIIDPAIKAIGDSLRDAKKIILQEIETPAELSAKIEEKCRTIEEYIPYLPDELKDEPCGAMNMGERPRTNHLTNQIEDKNLRMRAEADDHFQLNVWSLMNILEKYSHKEHIQSIRIDALVSKFLKEYHGTRRRDLPVLLRRLCANIRSTDSI
jgi:hypothetical protein